MQKIFPLLIALFLTGQSLPLVAAPANHPSKAMAQNPRQRYEHLGKVSDPWDILNDSQVKAGIRRAMGNKEEEYWQRSQLLDDSRSKGDEILIAGDVRGLAGSLVSLLYINRATGRLLVGYFDGSDVYLFGLKDKADVPQVLKQYLDDTIKDKPIKIGEADFSPTKKKIVSSKPLNLQSLTGTYDRAGGRFNSGILYVEQLPNEQIKFQILAYNGGNSGQAEGTIKVKNGSAIFQQETGKITLKFAGGQVTVTGDDSYFCGNAVTLCGTYKKSADRKPKFAHD